MDLPEKIKAKIKRDVGDYLIESVLQTVHQSKSPVEGEDWPGLSKAYKAKKIAEGGVGKANMELEGDMLDSLDYKPTKDGIEIGFFDDQAWKADGHLKFSGKENNTPQRRFLPGEGESFIAPIQKEIESIVSEAIADNAPINKSDLESVATKSDLYDLLSEFFDGLTRAEIKATVLRSDTLTRLLDDAGLLDLL